MSCRGRRGVGVGRFVRAYGKAWLDAAMPDFAKGLRGGVATLVPFYFATRLGRHEFAWMALGGWLGTLVDPGGLRSTRAKTLSAFALAGGVAVAFSEGLAANPWLAAGWLALLAMAASLLRSLGAVWASAGTMLTIVVVVGSARGGTEPLRDGCFFAAGAAVAVFLSSVIWPIWTHLPLRRAEATVFDALARYASETESCVRAGTPEGDPRWTELARIHHRLIRNATEDARRLALGGRARRAGETRVGSNLRVLLGVAEAQLPLLVTLKEASELDPAEAHRAGVPERLRALAKRNQETAEILRTPNLRGHESRPSLPPPAHLRGPASSIHALLEHLDDASRTAQAMTSSLDAPPNSPAESVGASKSVVLDFFRKWRGDWAVLRDACSPRSTFFHHGLRVAITVSITSLLAGRISLHPHWITVTTLAVLQPYSGATATRAAQRVVGTVLGSIAAVAINMTVHGPILLAAVMFPLSVAAVATHRRNYRLFTFFLTPVFVLIAERFPGDWWTAAVRAGAAALGGGIAFVAAVLIFPSRETTRLPDLLASMLDHVARYAVVTLQGLGDRHAEASELRINAARRDTGIALGEAESSFERLLAEPRHDTAVEEYALQLITYARRATGALTAIDTYAARDLTPEGTLPPALAQAIAAYVVNTLQQAAASARGREPAPDAAVPALPSELDTRLRATLARLLRGADLISDVARRAARKSALEFEHDSSN
ncbi:MAG: FUSC family protein [Pseudomonadota bacterium]